MLIKKQMKRKPKLKVRKAESRKITDPIAIDESLTEDGESSDGTLKKIKEKPNDSSDLSDVKKGSPLVSQNSDQWHAYKKINEDFVIVQPTKTVNLSPSNSIGFFQDNVRENHLHAKVNKLDLEEEKQQLGIENKYYREYSSNEAGAMSDFRKKLMYKVNSPKEHLDSNSSRVNLMKSQQQLMMRLSSHRNITENVLTESSGTARQHTQGS